MCSVLRATRLQVSGRKQAKWLQRNAGWAQEARAEAHRALTSERQKLDAQYAEAQVRVLGCVFWGGGGGDMCAVVHARTLGALSPQLPQGLGGTEPLISAYGHMLHGASWAQNVVKSTKSV